MKMITIPIVLLSSSILAACVITEPSSQAPKNLSASNAPSRQEMLVQSAASGDVTSQVRLADMYASGEGRNHEQAAKLYRLAAEQGHEYAQRRLGQMYSAGAGVQQSYAEAAQWYKKAAIREPIARFNLARLYQAGRGVPKDTEQAKFYYMASGMADGYFSLGQMYFLGKDSPKDDVLAFKWHWRAAQLGQIDSQTFIGFLYRFGKGIKSNKIRSYMWYEIAALSGNRIAKGIRDKLATTLTKPQIIEAKRLANERKLEIEAELAKLRDRYGPYYVPPRK